MPTLAMEGNTERVCAMILENEQVTTNEMAELSLFSSWNYPKPTWIS
jgi:hypothetical protein